MKGRAGPADRWRPASPACVREAAIRTDHYMATVSTELARQLTTSFASAPLFEETRPARLRLASSSSTRRAVGARSLENRLLHQRAGFSAIAPRPPDAVTERLPRIPESETRLPSVSTDPARPRANVTGAGLEAWAGAAHRTTVDPHCEQRLQNVGTRHRGCAPAPPERTASMHSELGIIPWRWCHHQHSSQLVRRRVVNQACGIADVAAHPSIGGTWSLRAEGTAMRQPPCRR